jgi:hypothetical protein
MLSSIVRRAVVDQPDRHRTARLRGYPVVQLNRHLFGRRQIRTAAQNVRGAADLSDSAHRVLCVCRAVGSRNQHRRQCEERCHAHESYSALLLHGLKSFSALFQLVCRQ